MVKKSNNKGFTLVEVIIAVIILGIVITPLLANFVQAMRVSKKSRTELNATNMAQNIMEGMSARTAEELIKAFATGGKNTGLSIMPKDMEYTSYGELSNLDLTTKGYYYTYNGVDSQAHGSVPIYTDVKTVNSTDPDGNPLTEYYVGDVFENMENKYAYFVTGIKGAKNTTYDLRIVADATGHEAYNNDDMMNITKMNGTYDCMWADEVSDFNEAIEQLYTTKTQQSSTKEDLASALKRTMTVRIYNANEGTTDPPNYVVAVQNSYESINSAGQVLAPLYTAPAVDRYYSQTSGQNPRNVYVYLWPNYTTIAGNEDTVVVNNEAGIPINIVLTRISVEQSQYLKETSVANEQNYKANVILEGTFKDVDFRDYYDKVSVRRLRNQITSVYTNMRENIAYSHEENVKDDGYGNLVNPYYSLTRMTVTPNMKDKVGNFLFDADTSLPEEERVSQKDYVVFDIAGSESANKLYDVTLEVYEGGAAALGFPEEMRLTTFTGGASQ